MSESEIVKGYCAGYPEFDNCLIMHDTVLKKGNYTLLVEPCWDVSTTRDKAYKHVVIDVYAKDQITLAKSEGMPLFEQLVRAKAK